MHYNKLAEFEDQFLLSAGNNEYDLRSFSLPIKNENLSLEACLCSPKNRSGYYYDRVYPKKRIVLHYTAGQIRSDLSTLTRQDYHVSVPFVIGRNGLIYQLFSSRFWSGHLGKGLGNTGTGNAEDKATIGIELSNYGYLKKRADNLETYYSRLIRGDGTEGPVDIYCNTGDKEAYLSLETTFRGETYFAGYTSAQYQSLIILIRYLTRQYGIPRNFLEDNKRFLTDNTVLNFNGIVSHINYRSSGKWDIGPAFDWQQVINGVQAESYTPRLKIPKPMAERSKKQFGKIDAEELLEEFLPTAADPSTEDDDYEEEKQP